MAAYIDDEYCYERFGEQLTLALTTRLGGSLDSAIVSASAFIATAMRTRGYSPGDTTTDDFVKMATFGCLWEQLASMPKASLKLPEGWDRNPFKLAYDAILDGTAELATAPSTSRSIGGSQWSDRSSTSDDPKRATRDELAGY